MQVVCSKCKTRYNIPAERLESGVLKVRCKHCGHVFGVRKKMREPVPLPMEPLDITPHLEKEEMAPREEESPQQARDEETSAGRADDAPPALEEAAEAPTPSEEPPDTPPANETAEEPAGEEAEAPSPFGDFNLDDLAFAGASNPPEEPVPSPEEPSDEFPIPPAPEEPPDVSEPSEVQASPDELGFNEEQAQPEEEETIPEPSSSSIEPEKSSDEEPEEEFSFDDLSLDEYSTSPKAPSEPEPAQEQAPGVTYDKFAKMRETSDAPDLSDLDLSEFDTDLGESDFGGPAPSKPAEKEPPAPEIEKEPVSAEDFAKTLGELDLGSFDEPEESPQVQIPLEKVSSDELLSIADTTPAKPVKAPTVKKPRGPFPWALLSVVLFLGLAVAFLVFNILTRPDSAFILVNPFAISEILERNAVQKNLAVVEPLKGGYVDRDDKKRVYAVLAHVQNLTSVPVSAVRVRAKLFGAGGGALAFREAYCGNVVGKDELLGLPLEKVVETGELQVGAAFANVDIKPQAKVSCLVIFTDPPPGVQKFSVDVVGPAVTEKKEK